MKFKLYYRMWKGEDGVIYYGSLEAMQFDIRTYGDSHFEYINACVRCEDGSEEIVYSSHKEIMNAR